MCVLHIHSNRDSFAGFLATTGLPVYQSHEKGDVKLKLKGTTHDDYGFSCEVSQRAWTDTFGQIEDAVRFLETHSAELRSLTSRYQVDDIRLDFPFESRLSKQVFAQFDYLSPRLVRACAEYGIGIEISHYAPRKIIASGPDAGTNGRCATQIGNSNLTEWLPPLT